MPLTLAISDHQAPKHQTDIKQRGFSLLEVLITLIILSIGMLGIARILLIAQKANNSSYLKQQAVQCAYDILDRARANRQAAINGSYNVSNISASPTIPSISVNCASATCTATQLASYDTAFWLAYDVTQLPTGSGSVTTSKSGNNTILTVTVQWDDSAAQKMLGASSVASTSSSNLVQLVVQTLL